MAVYKKDTQNDDTNSAPMVLPSAWPDATGTWQTDPAQIAKLAGQLAAGPGADTDNLMNQVQATGLVEVGDLGNTPAGQALAEVVKNTHTYVGDVYAAFQAEFAAAVALLRSTAQSHGSALEATDTSVRQAGAAVDQTATPPSVPSVPTLGSAPPVSGRKGLD